MRSRVVFCGPTFAFPPIGGPELRVFNTLKAISAKNDVTLIVWNDLKNISSEICQLELKKLGIEILTIQKFEISRTSIQFPFLSSKINTLLTIGAKILLRERHRQEKHIAKEIVKISKQGKFNLIWFSYANVSLRIIKRIKKLAPQTFLVSDTDSVWSRYILRATPYLPTIKKIYNILNGLKKIYEEKKLVRVSDVTTAVSEIDQKYYLKLTDDSRKVQLAYNVIELSNYEKVTTVNREARTVLLAGTYGSKYSPMDNAATWFLKEVWPKVIKEIPSAKIYIVGRNSNKLWKSDFEIGLNVEGEVPSIFPYLQKCSVSVVPLWFESGTRFKILEAAASNVPVVSTTLGVEGLNLVNREEILISNNAEQFAELIIELFETEIGSLISKNAFARVKSSYGIDTLEKQVENIVNRSIASSKI